MLGIIVDSYKMVSSSELVLEGVTERCLVALKFYCCNVGLRFCLVAASVNVAVRQCPFAVM